MATKFKGTDTERRALDTFIKLVRAADAITGRVHGHLAAERLTDSQFGVLEALYHLGALCQRELSEKLLKSGANMTTVVDNLEARGLVRRERDAKDRRFVTVHLTPEGRALISRVFPRHVEAIVAELRYLGPDEQDRLGSLCRKLGRQK